MFPWPRVSVSFALATDRRDIRPIDRVSDQIVRVCHALAVATDSITVWISSSIDYSLSNMEQVVIFMVLADHEIAIGVVCPVAVHMVNFSTTGKSLPKRLSCD